MLPGAPLRRVTEYLWTYGTDMIHDEVPATEHWPLSPDTVVIDGRRYIAVSPTHAGRADPDAERLSCGHEQAIREWNGHKWFNRRRRCIQCACESQ